MWLARKKKTYILGEASLYTHSGGLQVKVPVVYLKILKHKLFT